MDVFERHLRDKCSQVFGDLMRQKEMTLEEFMQFTGIGREQAFQLLLVQDGALEVRTLLKAQQAFNVEVELGFPKLDAPSQAGGYRPAINKAFSDLTYAMGESGADLRQLLDALHDKMLKINAGRLNPEFEVLPTPLVNDVITFFAFYGGGCSGPSAQRILKAIDHYRQHGWYDPGAEASVNTPEHLEAVAYLKARDESGEGGASHLGCSPGEEFFGIAFNIDTLPGLYTACGERLVCHRCGGDVDIIETGPESAELGTTPKYQWMCVTCNCRSSLVSRLRTELCDKQPVEGKVPYGTIVQGVL